jgi:hypothetical protein
MWSVRETVTQSGQCLLDGRESWLERVSSRLMVALVHPLLVCASTHTSGLSSRGRGGAGVIYTIYRIADTHVFVDCTYLLL